jgi:hypothetical protein
MRKSVFVIGAVLLVIVLAVFSALSFKVTSSEDGNEDVQGFASVPVSVPPTPVPKTDVVINYQKYNIDYMNDNIKKILVRQAGAAGKTVFYLPPTGYINVSRGTKYGIAFLIQNVNPKVPEGNEFVYNFDVDPSSVGDCGVSAEVAQSWIERGWTSYGMISGQWREDWNEWHDAMTVYFSFPSDVEPCSVKYNFVITKDGAAYDSRTLEFNLV